MINTITLIEIEYHIKLSHRDIFNLKFAFHIIISLHQHPINQETPTQLQVINNNNPLYPSLQRNHRSLQRNSILRISSTFTSPSLSLFSRGRIKASERFKRALCVPRCATRELCRASSQLVALFIVRCVQGATLNFR